MKIFICFLVFLAVIFPLYNFQSDNILSLAKAESVVFVNEKNGKQTFEEGKVGVDNTLKLNKSTGIVLKTSLGMDELKERLKLKVVKTESINGNNILYAYSPYYSKKISLAGKASNVQIVEKEGYVLVGLPIIYSGF